MQAMPVHRSVSLSSSGAQSGSRIICPNYFFIVHNYKWLTAFSESDLEIL